MFSLKKYLNSSRVDGFTDDRKPEITDTIVKAYGLALLEMGKKRRGIEDIN
jgi:hypothetical protein